MSVGVTEIESGNSIPGTIAQIHDLQNREVAHGCISVFGQGGWSWQEQGSRQPSGKGLPRKLVVPD